MYFCTYAHHFHILLLYITLHYIAATYLNNESLPQHKPKTKKKTIAIHHQPPLIKFTSHLKKHTLTPDFSVFLIKSIPSREGEVVQVVLVVQIFNFKCELAG